MPQRIIFFIFFLMFTFFLLTASPILAQAHKYIGNPKSGIYHNSSCRYFNCKACTVILLSPTDAKQKNFRPCKICKG